MRTLLLSVLAIATLFPARGAAQAPDATRLVGRWSGNGTFFNAELQQKVGSRPVVIEFNADLSGTGRIVTRQCRS